MKTDVRDELESIPACDGVGAANRFRIAVITSVHPDFDARVWKCAKSLAKVGHSVVLICPWAVASGEKREGVRFLPFAPAKTRSERATTPFRILRALYPLWPELDVIHFHDLDMLPWMAILSLFKRAVYDVHENYPDEFMSKEWIPKLLRRALALLVRWGQLACVNIIRNVVLVAKSQERDIYGSRLRTVYIMNYASIELLNEVQHGYELRRPSVVFSGSQYVDNGSLLYLEIASQIHRRRKDVTFYAADRFLGNEAFRQEILNEVKKRGLDGVYKLLPNIEPHKVMSHLNRATIAIAPDLRVERRINAVPTKLFEFMAAGLPVVASNLPSQIEVIQGNEAGLLARPEDPETFVQAILKLLDDRETAARLGENGRRAFVKHYCWESQESVIRDYYRSIMAPGAQSNVDRGCPQAVRL